VAQLEVLEINPQAAVLQLICRDKLEKVQTFENAQAHWMTEQNKLEKKLEIWEKWQLSCF
jgi:hypothetical protein